MSASGIQGDWVKNRVEDIRSRDWDADWESAARIDGDTLIGEYDNNSLYILAMNFNWKF